MTLREWYDNMGPDIVFEEIEALYAPVRGSYKTLQLKIRINTHIYLS